MTRLPTPGQDDGSWGSLLNDFLLQAHNPDGTIKDVGIVAAKADDNTVIHNTGDETIDGTKTFSNPPVIPTPLAGTDAANKTYVDNTVSTGAPDASPTTKGLVQLTNDLGGTATAPTVPGLAGKVNTSRTINGHALTSDVTITKADVGLGNVDNTSDANKPVSTAQQTAIDAKVADTITDGTTTIAPSQNAVFDALALKQDSIAYTPENVANKDIDGTLAANSDIKYPSQKATKTYVDTQAATKSATVTPTAVKTTGYTAAAGDYVPVDTTGGSVTITLPSAPLDKTRIGVKMIAVTSPNTTTITAGGSDVFNKAAGSTSLTLTLLNQSYMLQYASSTGIWYAQSGDTPLSQLDARYVNITGAQAITGVKTFSTAPVISTITNTGTLTLPTSSDTLVGRATTDTLTNKTITDNGSNVRANSLKSATTTVDVSAAAAPSAGQVLTASSGTVAAWSTPTAAPVTSVAGKTGAVTLVEGDVANLTTDLANRALKGANSDITSLSGLTTPLSVPQGGTGASTLGSGNFLVGAGISPVTSTKAAPAGTVVGTTDTQTLTNKDLTGAGNTFPTLNQNTTGSAAKWTTARTLAGNSVDGSANVAFSNKFIVQGTSDAGLSAAQFLGGLSTGLVKNTTSTGVLSIATAGTDYSVPTGTETLTNKTITAPVIATITNSGNTLTLPTTADTLVGRATTDTLTNKRITKRVVTITDSANVQPNSDTTDVVLVVLDTVGANRNILAPSGTPTAGQQLMFRLTQDATGSRTVTWNAIYRFSADVPNPTLSTTASKVDYIGFQYNAVATTWDCLAVARGY